MISYFCCTCTCYNRTMIHMTVTKARRLGLMAFGIMVNNELISLFFVGYYVLYGQCMFRLLTQMPSFSDLFEGKSERLLDRPCLLMMISLVGVQEGELAGGGRGDRLGREAGA